LLVGRTPFETKQLLQIGLEALRRAIREQEPVRPSARLSSLPLEEQTTTAKRRGADAPKLISLLRGDLDSIVLKCLEKDRTLRYETPSELAKDIQRHLNNEAINARPPTVVNRFSKLIRRNRLAFAWCVAGAAAVVPVLVGTWFEVGGFAAS